MTREELIAPFKLSTVPPEELWQDGSVDLATEVVYSLLPLNHDPITEYDKLIRGRTAIAFGFSNNEKRFLQRHIKKYGGKFRFTKNNKEDFFIVHPSTWIYDMLHALRKAREAAEERERRERLVRKQEEAERRFIEEREKQDELCRKCIEEQRNKDEIASKEREELAIKRKQEEDRKRQEEYERIKARMREGQKRKRRKAEEKWKLEEELKEEQEREETRKNWLKGLGYLVAASVALLVIWQSGLLIPLGLIGLASSGLFKR